VGVAGEHEIDQRAAGMGDDGVGVVGLVGHENDGTVGLYGDSEIEVGSAGAGVVDAAEPETSAVTFDGKVLVDQDWRATGGERMYNHWGIDGYVVIAEDRVAQRGGKGGDDLCAAVGCVFARYEGDGAMSNEVAGEKDEVWGEGVDLADDALEEEGFGVLVEVDVAELNYAVAMEGGGKICDSDGALYDVDFVTSDLSGVESQSCGGGP
jgi:hypothetical protein